MACRVKYQIENTTRNEEYGWFYDPSSSPQHQTRPIGIPVRSRSQRVSSSYHRTRSWDDEYICALRVRSDLALEAREGRSHINDSSLSDCESSVEDQVIFAMDE